MSKRTSAYSDNAPKILLETLGARPATAILAATYLAFIFSCTFDIISTLHSFRTGVTKFCSTVCPEGWTPEFHSLFQERGSYGCAIPGYGGALTFLGRAGNMSNVISVSLKVHNHNSSVSFNETDIIEKVVNYDVSLYACASNGLCAESGTSRSSWQPVLDLPNQEVPLLDFLEPNERDANLIIFGNMFQNQESLPVDGVVQSYFFIVQFSNLNYLFTPQDTEVYYTLSTISRPYIFAEAVTRLVLLAITVVIFCYYCLKNYMAVPDLQKWVPERMWIICYFIALILYQNPLYFAASWFSSPPVGLVYAAYIVDAFGQTSFFVIWLLFADATRRRMMSAFDFYAPKICLGVVIFATNGAIISIQFPSIDPSNTRNPLTAVANWPEITKYAFTGLYLLFSVLLGVWFVFWARFLFKNGSTLQKLPYMSTRYLQLSYRFFFIQASLATLYYFFEYAVVVYFITENSTWHQDLNSTTDNINTLFRYQTQLMGKLIFLTAYAILLAFLFLPPGDGAASALSTSYVVTERELEKHLKARRQMLKKHVALSALSGIGRVKADTFCVDISLDLLEASHEAYYDPEGQETSSGYGPSNWESFGYEIIDSAFDSEYDTYCCIARCKSRNRIVVTFRGSACQKHWRGNFNFAQMPVDFTKLALPDLDRRDFLDVPDTLFQEFWPSDDGDVDRLSEQGDRMSGTLREIAHSVVGATETVVDATSSAVIDATSTMMNTTAGLFVAAASHTPGLEKTVAKYVHSGFWSAYRVVRTFVHEVLRREMRRQADSDCPDDARCRKVYFTGHSLGGALATLAALDFEIHSRGRINRYLCWKQRYDIAPCPLTIGVYSFGSPKVGNWVLSQLYNQLIPDTFRVVVDGDVVCATPPTTSYAHVGTEVVVDGLGAGSIVIDPSFVERWLHTSSLTSFTVHLLANYRRGIRGVRDAAIFMDSYASNLPTTGGDMDSVELALNAVILLQDDKESVADSESSSGEMEKTSLVSVGESQTLRSTDAYAGCSTCENDTHGGDNATLASSLKETGYTSDAIENSPGSWSFVFSPAHSSSIAAVDRSGLTSAHGLLTGDEEEPERTVRYTSPPTSDFSLAGMKSILSHRISFLSSSLPGRNYDNDSVLEQMISEANAVTRRPKKCTD